MKQLVVASAVVAVLAGCSTTGSPTASGSDNFYQAQLAKAEEKREKQVEKVLDKAPDWMTKLPKAAGVVYANGTARSTDFSMADEKAKMIAFGRICMTAGGEVDKQGKLYRSDTGDISTETSEIAIRELCRRVDVTGADVVELKRISEGSFYRSYVLLALPMGDANLLKKAKLDEEVAKSAGRRSQEAFKELDEKIEQRSEKN
jgi:hypothetical protein